MKAILLSALLLAALPTAAMAETDLGSVLMENAISYENTGARKAEDPLLLLSWPENAESVRYEVEIFKGLPEHLDRNTPLKETVYHDCRIYMNRILVRIPPVMDGTPLYWRVRPIDADWEGLAPFSAPMEVRSTMRLISRNAPIRRRSDGEWRLPSLSRLLLYRESGSLILRSRSDERISGEYR